MLCDFSRLAAGYYGCCRAGGATCRPTRTFGTTVEEAVEEMRYRIYLRTSLTASAGGRGNVGVGREGEGMRGVGGREAAVVGERVGKGSYGWDEEVTWQRETLNGEWGDERTWNVGIRVKERGSGTVVLTEI